jgi:hypothetical protein
MPTLDFPDSPVEDDEWTDNDNVVWIFWRGAWAQRQGEQAGFVNTDGLDADP